MNDTVNHVRHHVLLSLIDMFASKSEQFGCPLQLVLLPYSPNSVALYEHDRGEERWDIHWAPDSTSLAVTGVCTHRTVGDSLNCFHIWVLHTLCQCVVMIQLACASGSCHNVQ